MSSKYFRVLIDHSCIFFGRCLFKFFAYVSIGLFGFLLSFRSSFYILHISTWISIRYITWKCSLPNCGLPFHSADCVFWCTEVCFVCLFVCFWAQATNIFSPPNCGDVSSVSPITDYFYERIWCYSEFLPHVTWLLFFFFKPWKFCSLTRIVLVILLYFSFSGNEFSF